MAAAMLNFPPDMENEQNPSGPIRPPYPSGPIRTPNASSPIRPKNPSTINQYFITGEFVIIESPGKPWSNRPSVEIYSAEFRGQGTYKGKLSGTTKLKRGKNRKENDTKIITYRIKVYVEQNFGNPGAFVITNNHKHNRFFLEYATLHAPGKPDIFFDCRSWVYPYTSPEPKRIFFSNTCYLPRDTPEGLTELRNEELGRLRGNGTGERKECERIYDYDYYNDLGNPDKGREHIRPVLGGSLPYPRRGRTGRPPCKADQSSESRSETSFEIYVPPDERLSLKKQSELISNIIQVTLHFVIPERYSSSSSCNFESYGEIRDMFSSSTHEEIEERRQKEAKERLPNRRPGERRSKKIQEVEKWVMEKWKKISPNELVKKIKRKLKKYKERKKMEERAMGILKTIVPKKNVKEITRACKEDRKKFLIPHIIAEDEQAWKNDDEFGRQMLAGINPTRIKCLTSTLSKQKEMREFMEEAKNPILECLLECFRGDFHIREVMLTFMEKACEKAGKPMINQGLISKALLEEAWQIDEGFIYEDNRFFILDHHDYLMPFLSKINTTGVCAYASRTLLFRRGDDTLKPIAIELSLPDSSSEKENNSKSSSEKENKNEPVFFFPPPVVSPPFADDIYQKTKAQWQLAKAHVAANDSVYHQLISHWLHTHAVVEPFIIATRRQLSVMHPIHRLLDPHFKDTMHVNALARSILLNSGGILEKTLFSGKISMELSSALYKQWRFDEQALPVDLVKRNMAEKVEEKKVEEAVEKVEEAKHRAVQEKEKEKVEKLKPRAVQEKEKVQEVMSSKTTTSNTQILKILHQECGVKFPFEYYRYDSDGTKKKDSEYPAGFYKLLFEDYPYGADGLEIWTAVHEWVEDFCDFFYNDDDSVEEDKEIQDWWSDVTKKGHGDQKEGWYNLTTRSNLIDALTTLIWIASGLHASVNFGQYAYAAYPPNRPTLCRKFIPKEGTSEFKELLSPDKYFLSMLPTRTEMALGVALMYVLSRHTSDEVYLGQRPPNSNWTDNQEISDKFGKFHEKLQEIEKKIKDRNRDFGHKNRWGPAKIPYKLLYPDTSNEGSTGGITGKGIPNSISI